MKHPKLLLWLTLASLIGSVAWGQAPPTRSTPCNAATPANAICVSWEVPNYVDGTPIALPITYRVEQKAGATWTAVQTVSNTRAYLTGLAPGTYTFRVVAIVGGKESVPSNEAGRSVEQPAPSAPVIQVVQVVIGDHQPVFTVTKSGVGTFAGVARVGTECEGAVLFRWRGVEWRAPKEWSPWETASTVVVGAPCA